MELNIRERTQKVCQALSDVKKLSLRGIAQALGVSKSSVHRHQQAMARRNQYPESKLWESQAGAEWLKRLVNATLLIFCLKGGMGCETVAEFFHLLRLEQHVGGSVASLRKIRSQLETHIIDYGQEQLKTMPAGERPLEICASADETFFDQAVLVLLDLASGFIVVETFSEDHRYETWQQQAQQALSQLGLQVRYCVSDRAKALVKLALEEMGCASIADLFHALWELSSGIGRELSTQIFQVNRRLRQLSEAPENPALQATLQQQQTALMAAQQQFHQGLRQLSLTLHPFSWKSGTVQTTQQVAAQLSDDCQALLQLKIAQHLPDQEGSIAKFERQIQDLSAVVDLWWQWVQQSLQEQGCDPALQVWLAQVFLPLSYWQAQSQRTKTPALKVAYQSALQQAQAALTQHPLTATLSPAQRTHWQTWANVMVSRFQRASSAVEGRNGYLKQIYHNRRGLSSHRLQVMTTLHNFYLKRADGTTAAQRLFGKPVPDLFEHLIQQMPNLPQARRRKTAAKPENPALHNVPA